MGCDVTGVVTMEVVMAVMVVVVVVAVILVMTTTTIVSIFSNISSILQSFTSALVYSFLRLPWHFIL